MPGTGLINGWWCHWQRAQGIEIARVRTTVRTKDAPWRGGSVGLGIWLARRPEGGVVGSAIGAVAAVRTDHLGILFLHLVEEGGKRFAALVTKKFYRVIAHNSYPLLA